MEKQALCKESPCEFERETCCRDCQERKACPEVCDGVEEAGCAAACAWRIEG